MHVGQKGLRGIEDEVVRLLRPCQPPCAVGPLTASGRFGRPGSLGATWTREPATGCG